ncbi:hypothetical protein DBR42_06570 [Pelomonas sp. HMWF004]|nr:hypothetical protein DBR42_06570 [Pelomonas sp. HMWF004]
MAALTLDQTKAINPAWRRSAASWSAGADRTQIDGRWVYKRFALSRGSRDILISGYRFLQPLRHGATRGQSRSREYMAKEPISVAAPQDYTATEILAITIEANLSSPNDAHVNAYQVRNDLLLQRRLARVRYENGVTLPATAKKLRADANRKVRHSRILARNIRNATGEAKPTDADTHHVVATQDRAAERSRRLLFKWGIGINDKDNGLYLPKNWSSKVAGLEEATAHEVIHTLAYHLAVTVRLQNTRPSNQVEGRKTLCDVKYEILHDEFEY